MERSEVRRASAPPTRIPLRSIRATRYETCPPPLDEQLLPRRPIERVIERTGEAIKQFVDFGRRDHQRRTDGETVGERPHDQTLVLRELSAARSHACLRIERTLAAFVGHE